MDVHVEIAAETLFHVGPIPVTNSMLTMFIVMGALLFAGWMIARSAKEIPGPSQSVFEMIVEFMMGLVESSAGRKLGRQIFPLVAGIFGFFREETTEADHEEGGSEATEASNFRVFDIAATGSAATSVSAPAAEEGEEHEKVLVPFFRAPNADLNMTLAMALVTFTAVQIMGVRAHGFVGRIKHMANPPFLFPIELISELSRIISLSARLFGNVFAGEVLLAVMYSLSAAIKIAIVPFLFPVVFLFLELMFGAIQALVFALLTLIYIALASEGGHDDQVAHGHAAPGHGVQPAAGHAD
jgi:F-type H+-transporting ATPase subunit a